MHGIIEQLWVILANGTCLVHRNYRQDGHVSWQDMQVISGCLSAILSLIKSLNAGEIECIRMNSRSIHFINHQTHTTVIVTKNERKAKKVSKLMNKIDSIIVNTCNTDGMMLDRRDGAVIKLLYAKLDFLLGYICLQGKEQKLQDLIVINRQNHC